MLSSDIILCSSVPLLVVGQTKATFAFISMRRRSHVHTYVSMDVHMFVCVSMQYTYIHVEVCVTTSTRPTQSRLGASSNENCFEAALFSVWHWIGINYNIMEVFGTAFFDLCCSWAFVNFGDTFIAFYC